MDANSQFKGFTTVSGTSADQKFPAHDCSILTRLGTPGFRNKPPGWQARQLQARSYIYCITETVPTNHLIFYLVSQTLRFVERLDTHLELINGWADKITNTSFLYAVMGTRKIR